MSRFRMVLAAALLALPVIASNASTEVDESAEVELQPAQQSSGCCWALIMGRWYCVPCY